MNKERGINEKEEKGERKEQKRNKEGRRKTREWVVDDRDNVHSTNK